MSHFSNNVRMRVILRWVPRLVVQIILRKLGIRCQSFQSKKCVWIALHICIGALEQLVRLDVVNRWRKSTSSTVNISVYRYYLLSDNTTPLCIMGPDKISVMNPTRICRRDIKQIQIHQHVESVECSSLQQFDRESDNLDLSRPQLLRHTQRRLQLVSDVPQHTKVIINFQIISITSSTLLTHQNSIFQHPQPFF